MTTPKADHAAPSSAKAMEDRAVLVREWISEDKDQTWFRPLLEEHNALVRAYLEREAELRAAREEAEAHHRVADAMTERASMFEDRCGVAEVLAAERFVALQQVHDVIDGEIAIRFRTNSSKAESENAGASRIYRLLVLPRNMLAAALGEKP